MRMWNLNGAKLALALLAAMIIIALGFLALRHDSEPTTPKTVEPAPPPEKATVLPEIPATLLRLDRRALLQAANLAADSMAAGAPLPESNKALIGRNFDIRLPFGCSGPLDDAIKAADAPWASWTFNQKTRALRLRARPEQWGELDWVSELAGDLPFEAAEGFWIERPWTSAETCPPPPVKPAEPAADDEADETGETAETPEAMAPPVRPEGAAPQTLGIARFFAPDEPRTLRRGSRPYSTTVKQEAEPETTPRHFNLLISGRVTGFADGQPIRCRDNGPAFRPTCLIAVQFTTVAFENPRDGTILADWTN